MKILKLIKLIHLTAFISICSAKLPNKLTGGKPADIKNYNWHASIYYKDTIICSGAIISMAHILTSASCILLDYIVIKGNLKVLTDTHDDTVVNAANFHNISYIIFHEYYNAQHFWINDIAIVRLEKLMNFSKTRSSIALPNSYIRARAMIKTTEWTKTNPLLDDSPKSLRVVVLKSLSHEECYDIFQGFTNFHTYRSCSVADDENMIFSDGDSGNPVFYKNQLVGITSITIKDKPDAIFVTRVWTYKEWILNILEKH